MCNKLEPNIHFTGISTATIPSGCVSLRTGAVTPTPLAALNLLQSQRSTSSVGWREDFTASSPSFYCGYKEIGKTWTTFWVIKWRESLLPCYWLEVILMLDLFDFNVLILHSAISSSG